MFTDITNAIAELSRKGIVFNVGFTNDSYLKLAVMVMVVSAFTIGLQYVVFGKA